MSRFTYTGLDATGASVTGVIEADSRDAALTRLGEQLAVVTQVKEVAAAARVGARRVRSADVLSFTDQLAATVGAAVPLPEGLELIRRGFPEGSAFRDVTASLLSDVRGGARLSDAMQGTQAFPGFYVASIQAAEAAASMERTLTTLARYIKRSEDMRSRIRGAMAYPALIIGFTLVVSGFILTFGVAQLADIFKGMNVQLPLLTRLLVQAGTFLGAHWMMCSLGAVATVAGLARFAGSETGQAWIERRLLTSRLTADLSRDLIATRFASIFSMLFGAGVPVAQALGLAAEALGSSTARGQIKSSERRVLEGSSLSASVGDATCFPDTLQGMISVGEASGTLDLTLGRAAEHFEARFENGVQTLLTLLEPGVMIMVGLVVGVIIVALGLPFLSLSGSLGQ